MNQIKNWFTSVFAIGAYLLLLLEVAFSILIFLAIPIAMGFGILKFLLKIQKINLF